MNKVKVDAIQIGAHIVKLRKEQRITQEELAKKVNLSATHVSTVENGGSYSLNTLISICDALGARLDYVLYGEIRNNKRDNLVDLLNVCTDREIDILESIAHTLIDNREK